MITVSDLYKEAIDSGRERKAFIYDTDEDDYIRSEDDLLSLKITSQGDLLRTVMRQVDATFYKGHTLLDKYVTVSMGINLSPVVDKGEVAISGEVFTLVTHGLKTGDRVKLLTGGTLPSPLELDTYYYVVNTVVDDVVDPDVFGLAETYDDAVAETPVLIDTTGGSGTHTLNSFPLVGEGDDEYIDYGSFKIVEELSAVESEDIKVKGYDSMYESLQKYDLVIPDDFPMTVLEYLEAICSRLGWTLGTTEFPNYDFEIPSDPYIGLEVSFREVLDDIAEASGSIIYFGNDDTLYVKQVSHDTSVATLVNELFTLKKETQWGVVNSIVLSRTPAEDNIVEKDQTSIDDNGLTEIKIENNELLDSDRETTIVPIFEELEGLSFRPFEVETNGLGYFETGDRIKITDTEDVEYEVVVLRYVLNMTGALEETLGADKPLKTFTAYQYAGVIGQAIKRTEIIVDKQQGQIEAIAEDTEGLKSSVIINSTQIELLTEIVVASEGNIEELETRTTSLELTAEQLEIGITGMGGVNLLKNSSGLKGTIEEWQVLDTDGNLIDADNNGTVIQSTLVQNNTESGSGIQIEEQYIVQSFPTLVGEVYTLYCRYYKSDDCDVTITGVGSVIPLGSTDGDWDVFKYQFTAGGTTTTVQFDNTAYAGSECIIADAVCKLGDVTGWSQAPNEVYGANFKFDKDGLHITKDSSGYSNTIDEDSLTIENTSTSTIIAQVTKDAAKLTNVTVQEELIVQRYDEPSGSLRFIPVSDGAYVVVND